ncbi:RING finger domain protein [Talaromyces proteolyticus]|uniref:RING-type E3 ubiquitin transferase n=1 Tax=Talaromyces proteolyticus TaxID=1131652 RepID=A0AAD4KJM5_9EURO|nr:RING finger domain protein [Talaromyces proteolyticus]KAH8693945.1 RING finger domain protein [Talaromyces proteolyticus]
MADDVNLQQDILQRTLQEVAHEDEDDSAHPCVICLDSITEPAIAIPCKHDNFDFLCLASWLQQRRACPLCKADVTAVKYELQSEQPKLYVLPPKPEGVDGAPVARPSRPRYSPYLNRRHPQRRPYRHRPVGDEDAITRRRHVYRHQLFSLRVGSNRLSQYRELTPQLFTQDENLVSRARKWIRRELQVFEFLNPDGDEDGSALSDGVGRLGGQRLANRRTNNAEFLLEYIIAILRTVDVKGSAGQAEELLQEFIGRTNARLFLHELQSWLRSPYNSLQDWDRHVQYDDTVRSSESSATGDGRSDSGQRSVSGSPRVESGRVSKHYCPHTTRQDSRHDSASRARCVQSARDRYRPD